MFESEIAGILEANCLKCHSGEKPKGGLDLTRRAAIIKGGESGSAIDAANPAESLLIKAINYDGYEMPPTGQMSPQQIELLSNWVKNGLAWPKDLQALHFEAPREPPRVNEETKKHWSFQPVKKPTVPDVGGVWAVNDIDRFIQHQLENQGLISNGPAGARERVRRTCYDLTGAASGTRGRGSICREPHPSGLVRASSLINFWNHRTMANSGAATGLILLHMRRPTVTSATALNRLCGDIVTM